MRHRLVFVSRFFGVSRRVAATRQGCDLRFYPTLHANVFAVQRRVALTFGMQYCLCRSQRCIHKLRRVSNRRQRCCTALAYA